MLSDGAVHVTDHTNAAVTGLLTADCTAWSTDGLRRARHPDADAADASSTRPGCSARRARCPGAPPIAALVGDQQGSLVGQGCVRPGLAKITFGTGGMLDVCTGPTAPGIGTAQRARHVPDRRLEPRRRSARGASRRSCCRRAPTSSGCATTSGIIDTAADSHDVAAQCEHTDGVVYVPALLGLGTPHWDYGARGTLLGLTRGTGRPQVVRAVLEGIAHRGADLVEAAEADSGDSIAAHPGRRRDEPEPDVRPGAGRRHRSAGRGLAARPRRRRSAPRYLAGLAVGVWGSFDDIAAAWQPQGVVEPTGAARPCSNGPSAIARARGWIPDLSALDF